MESAQLTSALIMGDKSRAFALSPPLTHSRACKRGAHARLDPSGENPRAAAAQTQTQTHTRAQVLGDHQCLKLPAQSAAVPSRVSPAHRYPVRTRVAGNFAATAASRLQFHSLQYSLQSIAASCWLAHCKGVRKLIRGATVFHTGPC